MRCTARTKKGWGCQIEAETGQLTCHVHLPSGTFQQQQRARRQGPPSRTTIATNKRITGTELLSYLDERAGYNPDWQIDPFWRDLAQQLDAPR